MRYSIIRLEESDFTNILDADQARHYFEELIFPVHRKEVANAVMVEDGLEMISLSWYGEKVDIFKVYETHPLFNYPHIFGTHEGVIDHPMTGLTSAVIRQLKR